jgi:peptide deformylase
MPKAPPAHPNRVHVPSPGIASSGTYRRIPLRDILVRPHPMLAQRARELYPCAPGVVELADALVVTMRAARDCVGLSAPQIGASLRMIAVDVTGHRRARSCAGLIVLVNPRIIERSTDVTVREGCPSVPDFTGDVARAAEIMVEGFMPGSAACVRLIADGLEASALQHEIDHLDGVLFVDRVMSSSRTLFASKATT